MQKAHDYLLLVDSVSVLPEQLERHRTLVSNLEKVRSVAEKYYQARNQLMLEKKSGTTSDNNALRIKTFL
ncbi:MAG: hypothetical protein ACRDF4_06580 [Rhabdochlamydiaceae bacterium]